MPEIVVDLDMEVIPADHEVYVVRPGKGYRLYPEFISNSAIFADLPALDLTNGVPPGDHADLDQRVRRARALREWHLSAKGEGRKERPSSDLQSYDTGLDIRSVRQFRSIVEAYFYKIKKNDLVIVPPSAYSRPVYIGRVVSDKYQYIRDFVPNRYEKDALTGRRVEWLAQIEKRRLPSAILDTIEKPGALFLLARSFRPLIYETAYDNFASLASAQTNFVARFSVGEDNFTSGADLLFQAFVNFIAANIKNLDERGELRPLIQSILSDLGDYSPELKSNVNSPGHLTLLSQRIVPMVAAVLFALALQVGPEAATAAEKGMIIIGNSKAPPDDPCTAPVAESVLLQLKLLQFTEWPEACRIAKLAAEKTGIKGTVKVKRK